MTTDHTTTKRQANRRRLLNQAAQSLGFSAWGKLETAVIRDQIILSVRWMEPENTEYVDNKTETM